MAEVLEEEKELKTENEDYIAPLPPSSSSTNNASQFGRSKVFDPNQAWKWSRQSIAGEFKSMLAKLQDQTIEAAAIGDKVMVASDLEYMSDSDLGTAATTNNGLPNVESYHAMLTDMNYVQSISEIDPKHESNKRLKQKLDNLHDRISIFIKKVSNALSKVRQKNLKQAYQSAYDFLEDIQHEIEAFDDNLSESETALNALESRIKMTDSKYNALMLKFQRSKAKEKSAVQSQKELKKAIHELSIEYSQLMLKSISDKSAVKKGDLTGLRIPKQLQLPTVTKTILMKPVSLKEMPPKPTLNYPIKNSIDPVAHPEIYDQFKVDNGGACVSQFWTAFGREIGFFACNPHG